MQGDFIVLIKELEWFLEESSITVFLGLIIIFLWYAYANGYFSNKFTKANFFVRFLLFSCTFDYKQWRQFGDGV